MRPAADLTPAAAHVLQGRRLAVVLGSEVWVARGGRLMDVGRQLRLSLGGTGCYYDSSGRAGACYTSVGPFSLAPDGRHIALFLLHPPGETTDPTLLVVSRSDGSDGHRAEMASPCWECSVSTPSWDRNSRSFVVSEEDFAPPSYDTSVSKVYRTATRKVRLLSGAGFHIYSEYGPVVSPDGRWIGVLRSLRKGPHENLTLQTPRTQVELIPVGGGRRLMLPFPVRTYTALWWCGRANELCAAGPSVSYRIDVLRRRVSTIRNPRYDAFSADVTFAVTARRTGSRWTASAGPIEAHGTARLTAVLRSRSSGNPFGAFSVSDRK